MPTKLAVNEVYGPVSQGEGPSLGMPCAFLRVAACNLHCSWCDTAYTWDWSRYDKNEETHMMEYDEVVERVSKVLPPIKPALIISGGEPMLQQVALAEVVSRLKELYPDLWIEIETAGTIPPQRIFDPYVNAYNVSLKLEHSGNEKEKRYRPASIDAFQSGGKVQGWKFVAQQPSDFPEIDKLVAIHKLSPIYVMPEGVTPEAVAEHARAIADSCIERGWRLTPRMHIQMFGSERGH